MKNIKTLGDFATDDVIKKANKEKEKYQKHIDKINSDKKEQQKPKEKFRKKMDIKNYIIFLLGRREYSQKEIRAKLKLREHTDEEIEEALIWARENNYQSDERYTKNQVKYGSSKKSNNKLFYEMKSKGIDEDIIKEAIDILAPEEDRIIQALEKYKYKEMNDKLKEKAFRSLAMKGFSYSNIKRAWSIVFEDN